MAYAPEQSYKSLLHTIQTQQRSDIQDGKGTVTGVETDLHSKLGSLMFVHALSLPPIQTSTSE